MHLSKLATMCMDAFHRKNKGQEAFRMKETPQTKLGCACVFTVRGKPLEQTGCGYLVLWRCARHAHIPICLPDRFCSKHSLAEFAVWRVWIRTPCSCNPRANQWNGALRLTVLHGMVLAYSLSGTSFRLLWKSDGFTVRGITPPWLIPTVSTLTKVVSTRSSQWLS